MKHFRSVMAVAALAAGALLTLPPESAIAGGDCCAPACCEPVCCPPAPFNTTLCVNPPCSCCNTSVTVCVPGCCTEPPTVCWKQGLLGRQVGTYSWPCCGHEVKVVVTRHGDVRVRG